MHSLLEEYLANVATQMHPLPQEWRDEELRELREHLQNAIAARREQGLSEDEAAQAALEQFGPPSDFAESLVWVWQRGERRENRRSFLGAVVCMSVSGYLGSTLIGKVVNVTSLLQSSVYRQHSWMITFLLFLSATLVMALAGGVSGLAFPKRAVQGTAFTVAVAYAVSLGSSLVKTALSTGGSRELFFATVILMFNAATFGTPAVMSAWAGSRWRGRHPRPVRD